MYVVYTVVLVGNRSCNWRECWMYTDNNRLIALVRPWGTSIGISIDDMRCGSCCWCVGGVGGHVGGDG